MEHEVIMALIGCPGDVISPVQHANGSRAYRVDAQIHFLSAAEREAIDQIIGIGANYEAVKAFVDDEIGGTDESTHRFDGLYCRALKNGLEEQLDEYRNSIVGLEAELLQDPTKPISHLRFRLHAAHYHLTLPSLAVLVDTITGRRGSNTIEGGAQLLGLLHESATAGPVPVAQSMHRLAQHCHAVMYNMCAAWMLHGRLLDPHGDFFVARGGTKRYQAGARDSKSESNWGAWASKAWDAAPWDYADVVTSGGGCGGGGGGGAGGGTAGSSQLSAEEYEWHSAFVLRLDALPLNYLPTSLAQQVLFVGKAVRTLRRGAQNIDAREVEGKGGDEHEARQGGAQGLTDLEIEAFASEFENLKLAPVFHLLSFEALVRRMHVVVAKRLWRLVVVGACLVDHLQAVRDLVLLGKGELWHELILSGRALMQQQPTTRSEDALRDGPLAHAKRSCGLDEDEDGAGGGSEWHALASRLRLTLALDTFTCRSFDSLVGFHLLGCSAHNRDARTVVLAAPMPASKAAAGLHPQLFRSGALQSVGKKKVRRSFSSLCKFSWSAVEEQRASDGDSGAGGTAVAALKGSTLFLGLVLHNSSGSGGADGVEGCPNSLGVILELNHSGASLSVRHCPRAEEFSSATPTVKTLASVDLPRRPLPDLGHWLLVEYDASDSAAPCLKVFLDDPQKREPPILNKQLALHKVLSLDVGAGDTASVKLHAGIARSTNPAGGADTGSASAALHEWAFSACADNASQPPALTPALPSVTGSASPSLQGGSVVERLLDSSAAWDELKAEYAVQWPLHLVLTQDAAAQYNKLFALLWKTKRTCVELELVFPKLMEPRYRRMQPRDNVWMRPLQVLHGQMLFFLQNLYMYLQVDVVEAAHGELLAAVEAQQDFDAVRRAHASYLAAMTKKSHVGVRPLMDGLKRLMRLCRHFAVLFNNYSNAADIPHPEVAAISDRFRCDAAYLFLMLERTDAKELAARLDYNGWFSSMARSLTGYA